MAAILPMGFERTVSGNAFGVQRLTGLAGLAFAVLVGLVNIFVGASAPPAANASAGEIVDWVTEHRTLLGVASAVVPFGVVLLYTFVSGAYARLSQASPAALFWARLGGIGIILIEVLFLARVLFEVVLIANVDRLRSEPALVEILWQLQFAAMTLTGLGIGIALTGLARAARLGGLVPRWQQAMGFAAAVAFLVSAVATLASLEGSSVGIIGLPAFVTWLVWLAITSVRLMKDADSAA